MTNAPATRRKAATMLAVWIVAVVAAVYLLGWFLSLIVAVAVGGAMFGIQNSKRR